MIIEEAMPTIMGPETDGENAVRICHAANVLLHCGNDVGQMKQAIDELYHVFRSISAIGVENLNTPDIFLPSGKAISPEKAAHCLLEIKRTATFIRGIYKAINSCLASGSKKPVKLLYAGTGPYATLIIPLLTLYAYEQLVVDLVEINKKSLISVLSVLSKLKLFGFVDHIYFNDAATLQLERKYDIVVAEVMQAALKKEPQVAVMHNIVEQLGTSVVFIPEEVELSATIVSGNEPSPENNWTASDQTFGLGHIFTLNKFRTQTHLLKNTLKLPENLKENNQLYINTSIRVFEDEKLEESDCSLTLPVRVCRFKKTDSNEIAFWYELNTAPGVRCRLSNDERIFEALGKKDYAINDVTCTETEEQITEDMKSPVYNEG